MPERTEADSSDQEAGSFEMTLQFSAGTGQSANRELSLLRPFWRRIGQNREVGRLSFVFLESGGHLHTLGALCETHGGQLLFFPGLSGRRPRWQIGSATEAELNPAPGVTLDHLSLEPDMSRWHVRFLSKQRVKASATRNGSVQSRFPTMRKGDLVYWCALQVPGFDHFEEIPKHVKVTVAGPTREISHISRSTATALHTTSCHGVSLPGTSPDWNSCHIAVALVLTLAEKPEASMPQLSEFASTAFAPCHRNPRAKIPARLETTVVRRFIRVPSMDAWLVIAASILPGPVEASILSTYPQRVEERDKTA